MCSSDLKAIIINFEGLETRKLQQPHLHHMQQPIELRPSLRAENLTKEEVMNICYRTKNLTVLPPVKDLTLIRFFRETDLETIINLVIDNFNFIVIDGGYNIQHPLNISALMCCNKLFVVITQQEKSLNRYRLLKETFNITAFLHGISHLSLQFSLPRQTSRKSS